MTSIFVSKSNQQIYGIPEREVMPECFDLYTCKITSADTTYEHSDFCEPPRKLRCQKYYLLFEQIVI